MRNTDYYERCGYGWRDDEEPDYEQEYYEQCAFEEFLEENGYADAESYYEQRAYDELAPYYDEIIREQAIIEQQLDAIAAIEADGLSFSPR